ncbi:PREDICTED: cysteine and histidine-rich domain-containing protein [Polistes dominula]|uniref:Cysteine and histidine-rich domain-containing protein n=1 Tax=Polistes dominula TaxID=743375 RepID=A0ABM1ISR6_POLDO|nr:PREDICTED: cysteine and histidine-rich domain-containing protein [Polistes dominula]
MSEEKVLLHCYNRGCGKMFDPNDNKEGDCVHHPGEPVFHDAYKGWSCCSKKCTDFTEFLNIKGCTKSYHTNVKPIVQEKPAIDKSKANEVIEVRAKINSNNSMTKRPPFDSPQIALKPNVSPVLLEKIKGLTTLTQLNEDESQISIGQSCHNNSCKAKYAGPSSDKEICLHHPGIPIFHEGMKYWSCCQKKTTDFSVFLEQPGCTEGEHYWTSKNNNKKVQCRMDWHQTPAFVVVSIYAKNYDPDRSSVRINPIHLTMDLFLVEENSTYNLDIELNEMVNVAECSLNMLPTKVEVKLKKHEPIFWSRLEFLRTTTNSQENNGQNNEQISSQVDAIDLNDL